MKFLVAIASLCFCSQLWASGAEAAAASSSLSGTVLESIDVEPYSYLRLRTAEGEVWVAVSKTALKKGSMVTIEDTMELQNFQSKSLNRKFDRIVFGSLIAAEGSVSVQKVPLPSDIRVTKAVGSAAKTVAEVANGRLVLKDKSVAVRGMVVKVTPAVLGRNWVHLRDGTGSDSDGTNDLLVTTMAGTKVGEVVTAIGFVRIDRDFGSGYTYKVLVEDATVLR